MTRTISNTGDLVKKGLELMKEAEKNYNDMENAYQAEATGDTDEQTVSSSDYRAAGDNAVEKALEIFGEVVTREDLSAEDATTIGNSLYDVLQYDEALKFYNIAIAKGLQPDPLNLANIYFHGESCNDTDKAIYLYKKAAANGSTHAMCILGSIYEKSYIAESVKWYEAAGNNDDIIVMFKLYLMYSRAASPIYSKEKAVYWLIKGAALKEKRCIARLADKYYKGDGIAQDHAKALELYLSSADILDPIACKRVADIYSSGKGTEVNLAESEKWNNKAIERGYPVKP